MGNPKKPLPVKLFLGMLSTDQFLFDTCSAVLQNRYGPLDYESTLLPWNQTTYYISEMGSGIQRKFIFFERLIDPGDLPGIKLFANSIEQEHAVQKGNEFRRRINLDPGYVTEAKVVLATTKDFSHRMYIGSGIFAEVTLRFNAREHVFSPNEYTYPDYQSDAYRSIFHHARELLRNGLQKRNPANNF
ncbi:MAG: DUF4416 family protein [Nitrospirota bacterium]